MAAADYLHESQETVLWTNAELITPEDLNDLQRLRERRLLDHVLWHHLIEGGQFVDQLTEGEARPVGASFATVEHTTPNMTVWVKRGCVLFNQGTPWTSGPSRTGPEPTVIAHNMDADVQVTIDPAHATLDRTDKLSYFVEYDAIDALSSDAVTRATKTVAGNIVSQVLDKRRRTHLTIRYTPGTPGGGVPSADGHVLALISVPAADTTITQSQITDSRTPAGATRVVVPRTAAKAIGTWTETVDEWTVSGASQELRIPVHVRSTGLACQFPVPSLVADLVGSDWGRAFSNLRLLNGSIACRLDTSPTGTCTLWRGRHGYSAASAQVMDLVTELGIDDAVADTHYTDIFDDVLWSNGRTSPVAPSQDGIEDDSLFVRLISGSASDTFRGLSLTFYGV